LSGASLSIKEYLEHAFQVVKEIVKELKETEDVRAVVVFGSAVRPEDFIIGLSDIDVLVVTGEEPKKAYSRSVFCESVVDLTSMSIDRVRRIFELGSPLAFLLYGEGRVLADDGTFASIVLKPVVTEYTLKVLRGSTFTAIGLALEAYFNEDYGKSVSHAYHAVRHLIRYEALLRDRDASAFPLSDEDAKEKSNEVLRNLFVKLVNMRKRSADKETCRKILDEVLSTTSSELGLKHSSLSFIENNVHGRIALVAAKEKAGSIVVMVEAFTQNGLKRLEIGEGYIKEIESLFEMD
jgi:predicted nucleotidyltransferase